MHQILKFLTLSILALLFSCQTTTKELYIISNFKNIQELERQDHKFCSSLNLDGAKIFNIKSELYWRCRLSLAKYKLETTTDQKTNFQINDLVTKISFNLSELGEPEFIKEIGKLSDHQHKQCLRMGSNPDTLDQSAIDDYFLCRKRLIDDYELDPAFGNVDYLKYPNHTYDVDFVVDRRLAEEKAKVKAAGEKYPPCAKYNLRKENFKRCSVALDNSRSCMLQINKKKLKKEAVEKTICQKQSYVEFPDSFLEEQDNKELQIKEIRTNADVYNQNNFDSLGINEIDVKKFQSQKDDEKEKKEKKDINSKKSLYSKTDLTRLRQKYIQACHKEVDIALDKYVSSLQQECEEMKKFEELDE
ncbi:MAG: hypothetical protein KGQ36_07530 [Rickettsiales bacterium]|nr:hypothetical protein [Rickettsiales bacterium]